MREEHIEKVLKAKQLELQLCEAKVQQQSLIVQEELENNLREKQGVLEESLIYKKKCEELLITEVSRVGSYRYNLSDRYDELHVMTDGD